MGKRNTVDNTTFPNSSAPAITRSKISASTLSNLTHADSITRSALSCVNITRNPDPDPRTKGSATTLRRCVISNSTLSHTSCRRGKINESTLHNVRSARSLQAANSVLSDVASLRRVTVVNSTVTDQSAMSRSEARDSVVTESAVYRSSLEKSQVVKSRVKRSKLSDCEVTDCVIMNTDFRGMVLRNGVWRNGKLVGSVGEGVVAFTRDGKEVELPEKGVVNPEEWMHDLASETESSVFEDSGESGEDEDLPPPYKP